VVDDCRARQARVARKVGKKMKDAMKPIVAAAAETKARGITGMRRIENLLHLPMRQARMS
jgi:hypothetical protein